MQYLLLRSKRRTVAITLNSQGDLIIRAPKDLPSEQLELILRQKANWIERTKKRIQKQQKLCYNPLLDHKLILFGQTYSINFTPTIHQTQIGSHAISFPKTNSPTQQLVNFYKEQLKAYLHNQLPAWAKTMQVQYQSVKITKAKKRLGSCSGRKTLCFSWLNAALPTWVIDYIIVHELAHLKHLNHSPQFWSVVNTYYPNHQLAKKYIRQNLHLFPKLDSLTTSSNVNS